MSGVHHHFYSKCVFVFGSEQFYRRFSTPPNTERSYLFGCELGFINGYKPY
jgi:hypothetical protein